MGSGVQRLTAGGVVVAFHRVLGAQRVESRRLAQIAINDGRDDAGSGCVSSGDPVPFYRY